jgi:hypothetical protein
MSVYDAHDLQKAGYLNSASISSSRHCCYYYYFSVFGVHRKEREKAKCRSSLTSAYTFVLRTPQKIFIWYGRNSPAEERDFAAKYDFTMGQCDQVVSVEEGKEPAEFWTAIGGATYRRGREGRQWC